MVETAETMLGLGGHVRNREVIAVVAGTRTKSVRPTSCACT
jgi:hypothetical protein